MCRQRRAAVKRLIHRRLSIAGVKLIMILLGVYPTNRGGGVLKIQNGRVEYVGWV